MPTAAASGETPPGLAALHRLKSTSPPFYLSPSDDLSAAARLASEYLFSTLKPYATKSPFDHLLTEKFDAEQIWQQIDLQSHPLLSSLRRHVKHYEKNPNEIHEQFNLRKLDSIGNQSEDNNGDDNEKNNEGGLESKDFESGSDGTESEDDSGVEEEGDEDEEDEATGDEEKGNSNGVEDKFLKIKELEEYLEEDEAREYGLDNEKKKRKEKKEKRKLDEDESEDDEEADELEDGELGDMGLDEDDDDDDDDDMTENARYEDFFGGKKAGQKRKSKDLGGSDSDDGLGTDYNQMKKDLSTHEKELVKLRSEIEQMEKANLEPKNWTMQGEVTAAKRPKNSALEVDLDFEHNVRPAPVITEEVTASLEELIQKRILEGQFDDVQKPPSLPSKVPREKKELDDNKSKKGLAELYEDEYAQKTGLVSQALSFSDEQKKEASTLFKKLCLKLDALSHFHFTPKPIIEDLAVQANVPALAMEEVAPLAVSDAAMLAPEEVFAGKGDIKEETELTKAERKRRRAIKKRKYKAENAKRMAIKAEQSLSKKLGIGNDES